MELPDLSKAFEKAQRDLGKVNVLIAGCTGVGKSTLINSVFQGRLAATGQGEPVTQTTRLIFTGLQVGRGERVDDQDPRPPLTAGRV